MMHLYINGNDYHYAIEQLVRVFLPDIRLEKIFNSPLKEGEFILCETRQSQSTIDIKTQIHFADYDNNETVALSGEDLYKAGELKACEMLYRMLIEHTGYTPPWGMQTGVRPTKIFFNLLRNNSEQQAVKYLEDSLFISPQKAQLVQKVCRNEMATMASSAADEFSLYVSLPFCPSRCAYCSFISHSYASLKKLIPDYVKLLCKEIREIAILTAQLKLHLRTVYIGGGTPTVLSTDMLQALIDEIYADFDTSKVSEFTLEAGRPDTLSEEMLAFIKSTPITRITINAQSFNDEVLKAIGRNHTGADVCKAYKIARRLGFDNINTDIIAGLEGESVESFLQSVQTAIDLKAENITVHTLALKRSSFLITRDEKKGSVLSITNEMIQKAGEMLESSGYIPYYMYRQSKSVGNLENTGWAKPGKICEYNIFMMEEVQTVFGAGAGAVTRLSDKGSGQIARVFNYKYPYEYISGFDTMLARKHEAANIIKKWQKP